MSYLKSFVGTLIVLLITAVIVLFVVAMIAAIAHHPFVMLPFLIFIFVWWIVHRHQNERNNFLDSEW